jgi:hypothetical protein
MRKIAVVQSGSVVGHTQQMQHSKTAYCQGLALCSHQGAVLLQVGHLVGILGVDVVLQYLHAVQL